MSASQVTLAKTRKGEVRAFDAQNWGMARLAREMCQHIQSYAAEYDGYNLGCPLVYCTPCMFHVRLPFRAVLGGISLAPITRLCAQLKKNVKGFSTNIERGTRVRTVCRDGGIGR